MSEPVGQACWQGAVTQCLQTPLIMSQRGGAGSPGNTSRESLVPDGWGHGDKPEALARGADKPGAPARSFAARSLAGASGLCPGAPAAGNCSMNFTCRQVVADRASVLS